MSCVPLLAWHAARYPLPRPRFRARAWLIIAPRGVVASTTRFLRVGLYSLDIVVLGFLVGSGWGTYAAARRVVFAVVAIGLVIPAAYGPILGKAWAAGVEPFRAVLRRCAALLCLVAIPACVVLAANSREWMRMLFGAEFAAGWLWLCLLAARLPFLLGATLAQTALIARRREAEALRVVAASALLACVLVPSAAVWMGPFGVACSLIVIEVFGGALGWSCLAGADSRLRPQTICAGAMARPTSDRAVPLGDDGRGDGQRQSPSASSAVRQDLLRPRPSSARTTIDRWSSPLPLPEGEGDRLSANHSSSVPRELLL
jgi:O-antigen/teichoic acid export membrane protein